MPVTSYAPPAALNVMSDPTVFKTERGVSYHQAPQKTLYSLPWSQDYTEDSMDYSTPGSSCSLLSQEQLGLSPVYPGVSRGWNSGTPKDFNHGLFIDQEQSPTYTHTQMPCGTHQIVYRPALNADTANFSLSNMASSLPSTSPVNDRMLPNPVAGRSLQLNQNLYGRSEAGPTYNVDSGAIKPLNDCINIPSTSGNSTTMSYIPLSSSPDTISTASPQLSQYPSQSVPAAHNMHPEPYGASSHDSLYDHSLSHDHTLRQEVSSGDMYSYVSNARDSTGRLSIGSTLSSGQIYTRLPVDSVATYPTQRSSIDIMPTHAIESHPSSSSLRASG
jgi:hypothetical protein